MAGWLENSFGDLASLDYMKLGSSDPCNGHQLQPTTMSTNDDCMITRVSNTNQTASDMQVENTNGGTTNISAQNKPQHSQTLCQDQSKEINKTNDHSTKQADRTTTKSQDAIKPLTTCLPNVSRALNEGTQNQAASYSLVQRKPGPRMFSKKLFQTPRNWEMQNIRKLGTLTKKDTCVSVFAVVSYFCPPKQSGGTDVYFPFGLVDWTLYENDKCLKCICFQKFEQDMPLITNVGDIIKFPLRISIYKDTLQGRTFDDQFPWMTFDGRPNTPIVPRYSRCSAPTFTDADKKKVKELKSWAVSVGIVEPSIYVTLADLTDNLYFDLLCQVVHADSEQNVLHVWDGTEPSFKGLLSNELEVFASATKWGSKVVGKCVKVRIYGCDLGSTCKAGQYILIPSLHFMLKDVSDNERGGVSQIPFLTLHERMLSRRGIKVLDDADSDVKVLEQRMEVLPTPPTREPQDSHEIQVTSEQPPPDIEIDLSKLKITRSPKRRRVREDSAKATEIPVCNAKAAPAIQATENTTANETRVQPSNQETTIRAASIATTNQVLRSNQATKRRVDESCTSNRTIIKPTADEVRIPPADISRDVHTSQAIKPLVDESCISKQNIVKSTANDAGEPPADVSCDGNTNQATKPHVHESCATSSNQFVVKPTADEVRISPADISRDVHTGQVIKPPADESCISNEAIVKSTANDAGEPPADSLREAHTKQATKPRVDESCKTASNQAIVNAITDSRISLYTIRDIRNGTVPAKFRCWAAVRYAMPNKPKRFVKYVCRSCRQRYEPYDIKNSADKPDFSATVKCINPNCSATLSLTIQFSVILQDDTGLLDVAVSDKVARKFLPHVEPAKLLTDEEIQRIVVRFLKTLILKRCCIEFEIKSFIYPDGKTVYSLAIWNFHNENELNLSQK